MKTAIKLPNMYEYFLERGIELNFDEIHHWIDKKVIKGFRRVFFVNTFTKDAQILITAKGFLNVQLYYAKLDLKTNSSWFYIDIPVDKSRWITKYEIIVQQNNSILWEKTIKPTGWFEDLT